MTTVGLTGSGPAIEAIGAALKETDGSAVGIDVNSLGEVDVAVVVGEAGHRGFETAAENARETATPLIAVELGGIGGEPVADVNAAVSGYSPGTACFDCLCGRIAAAENATDDGEYEASTARFVGAVAGHELSEMLAGRASTVVGGVIEVPHAERRVLPLPYCDCAVADDEDGLRRHYEPRVLDDSIAMAEVAFDARLGPIANVGEAESFPVPYYLATLAGTPFSDADVPEHAAGVGLEWDPAFMKALGEALERYSAAVYRTADFEPEPTNPIPPERFVQPEDSVDIDAIDYWHPAEHLETGETVELPAETVVFPPPERRIRPAITTGLGFGNSGTEALLSGLYEVVERDAAMISWYSSDEPLGLDLEDEEFETLVGRARSEGLETTALLLTQDVDVPVVSVCVHRDGEWPRFAAAMSADLDPVAAARGALEEALQNWLELRRMGAEGASGEAGGIGAYAEFPEAAREFVSPETSVPAASVGPDSVPEGREELTAVIDRVDDAGLDAYGARITPRDIEEMGFEAVRVAVPEAQPLFTDDPYFGKRAASVPEEFGFESRLDREFHPFP